MADGPSGDARVYKLEAEQELRFEVDFKDTVSLKGTLSIAGTMAAAVMYRPLDVEEDFGGLPHSTGSTPLVYYYGYATPTEKAKLYDRVISNLGRAVNKKLEDDSEVKFAGTVINTPSNFAEPGALPQLLHAIECLQPTAILVIDYERLYSELKRQLGSKLSIVKLLKSGGVVTRDKTYRRHMQSLKIREYFYGPPKNQLNPYTNIVSYNELAVRRLGEGTLAPSSALPLGMERKVQETRVVKVEVGDILLNSVLAVSQADRLDAMPNIGSAPALTVEEETSLMLDNSLTGFIYVSEVDDVKHKVTVLTPNPGKLPKKYMMMATLKWIETV
ncbi:hypothetical protein HDU96_000674 [Phlyctochytrium bullatum]|nr:hypothetical protein HDU96_000674 [Phlyctochytrium bullatum]